MATAMAKVGKAKLRSIFGLVQPISTCWLVGLLALAAWRSEIMLERKKTFTVRFGLFAQAWPSATTVCSISLSFGNNVPFSQCLPCFASTFSPDMPCVPYRGPDASGSCDAKTFAGWTSPPNYGASIRDGVTHGLCGYEADTTEEKCSTYYAEGLQDEGTFYQCRWLSATGKSGKQVNLCVTWSAENKRWTHAAPTKRKLWRCWKLVKTAMPSFGAMRRSGKWKGSTQSSHFVGAWTPWPTHTLDHNTWGWSLPSDSLHGHGHAVWADSLGHWKENYGQYFNKSTCGCMSEDKCWDELGSLSLLHLFGPICGGKSHCAGAALWADLWRKNLLPFQRLDGGLDACKIYISGSLISCHVYKLTLFNHRIV